MVYFFVSTGFAVSVHYCMDEFASAQLGTADEDLCNRCGMESGDNKCCRDEVKVHKLQTSHLSGKVQQWNFAFPVVKNNPTYFLLSPFKNFNLPAPTIAHSPPLNESEIHVKNCVFRI